MSIEKERQGSIDKDAILVTVCVMSYNRPKLLERTLECITQQTHKNLEIIISDDCSPDVYISKLIASYAEKDQRIKYYIQKINLGYLGNLKFLLDKVNGDFVMWCDDDDWYDPTYIKKCLLALIDDENALTAFSYYLEADESGVPVDSYPNQANLLERLTSKYTYLRLLAYLFVRDGYGYYNIYYGLHRKEILSLFDPLKFGMSIDADVGMKIISLRQLLLVREHLFKKTVFNKKEYVENTSRNADVSVLKALTVKISAILTNSISRIREYRKFLRLDHALFISILSPLWIVSLLVLSLNHFINKHLVGKFGGFVKSLENFLPKYYNTRYTHIFSLYRTDVELNKLKTNIIIDAVHLITPISDTPHYLCASECLKNLQSLRKISRLDKSSITDYIDTNYLVHSSRYIDYVKQAHPETDAIESYAEFLSLIDRCSAKDLEFCVLVQRRLDESGGYYWLLIDGLHRSAILLALNQGRVAARVKFP